VISERETFCGVSVNLVLDIGETSRGKLHLAFTKLGVFGFFREKDVFFIDRSYQVVVCVGFFNKKLFPRDKFIEKRFE
jgi:hypothetical protein